MNSENYKIGVDIGGTNMKAVLFDGEKVVEETVLSTPPDNPEYFFNMLQALIDPLAEKAEQNKKKVEGLGLSIAGMHDFKHNIIVRSPNIPYLDGMEIISEVEKRIKPPVKFDNDANCFLRAEARAGSGIKFNNIFGITIGTGIGGAWWLNNKIYRGGHGSAGEVGHTIIQFSSPMTLEKFYQEITDKNPLEIAEEAYRGDERAEKVFEQIGEYLGYACANIINSIDPEAIIIGGGVSASSELFFPALKKTMHANIAGPLATKTKVIKAKLENNAGAIGAAMLFE
ncbi:MAG: ROK family protein [Patescibacteria group bacterium]